MSIYDLFNHTVTTTATATFQRTPGEPIPASAEQSVSVTATTGAFITEQSLVSFPLAAGLVVGLWKLAKVLFGSPASKPWVAVVLGFAIGMVIFLMNITDSRVGARLDSTQRIRAFVIALINSLYLGMVALGINPTL